MQLLPLKKLGGQAVGTLVSFGVYLPDVNAQAGNKLFVKIIHEKDQFIQGIQPIRFELTHEADMDYLHNGHPMDYWKGEVDISVSQDDQNKTHWGEKGTYLYRFELEAPHLAEPLDWIVDPFGREFGPAKQSAFTVGTEEYTWGENEAKWKTPKLHDLIVYELHINEFAYSLREGIKKLPYLADLGINCIEIMPTSNASKSVDWGFEPIGYFGIDERFGTNEDMKTFIECAHSNGIAVIFDVIYGHTGQHFTYEYLYKSLPHIANPFMGYFGDMDSFGASTDFRKKYVRDYFFTVNMYLLETFHLDGFRYDCVPNYYDGITGQGYANLVYQSYQYIKSQSGKFSRLVTDGEIRLVQCAEQLEKPLEVVYGTYSNCTWQNGTLGSFNDTAARGGEGLSDLGLKLGLQDYPVIGSHQAADGSIDTMAKSAFQYYENHDHPRFLCKIAKKSIYSHFEPDKRKIPVVFEANRDFWYKMQPYIIGLFMGKGVPLLWEGQEILEKYDVPNDGHTRIGVMRPVRWELFYDTPGKNIITLHRKVISLRNDNELFRSGDYYFHNHYDRWQKRGLLLFSREFGGKYALIALNFTDADLYTEFWFPHGGNFTEMLHGNDNLNGVVPYVPYTIKIPSNYGRIWIR